MPSPSDFRRGFELEEGQEVGSFTLITAHVGHEVNVQNERYSFPSTYQFSTIDGAAAGDKEVQELLKLLKQHTNGKRIVFSAYGSPYDCTFGRMTVQHREGAAATIACKGVAVRRHDIPTKAQEQRAKEEQQQAAGAPAAVDMHDPEVQKRLKPYRVIRSRFGSGKCSCCGGGLQQGERIAKRVGDSSRGGWSHVACVVGAIDKAQHQDSEAQRQQQRQQQKQKQQRRQQQATKGGRGKAGLQPAGGQRYSLRNRQQTKVEGERPQKKQKVEVKQHTATTSGSRHGKTAEQKGTG